MRFREWIFSIAAVAAIVCLSACPSFKQKGKKIEQGNRAQDAVGDVIDLEQGWTDDTQLAFYFTPQGSEIMPYAWLLVLEQANNTKLFRDADNIRRFRYIVEKPNDWNPDALPVGWVKVESEGEEWFGLTCAACHTNQLSYTNKETGKKVGIRVDGAPAIADFNLFSVALVDALQATHDDAAKFGRFATAVLQGKDTPQAREALQATLAEQTKSLAHRNQINTSDIPYGYGRIDAIGFIFNQVMSTLIDKPENALPSDAPVSYPFLWGTDQSDVVQWTGFAPNPPLGLGALVRNGGEVIGVYGKVKVSASSDTYSSSLKIENLGKLERWVREMRSPRWPEQVLPPIDREKAAKGGVLYKTYCADCHQVIPREDEGKPYKAYISPLGEIGTDSKELDNMVIKRATGPYNGKKVNVFTGDRIPAMAAPLDPLINAVLGALFRHPIADIKALAIEHETITKTTRTATSGYKARPLNGIWATAPFLHNGSVPNLYDLLLPAKDRTERFPLGSREFDPVKVGYVMEQPETTEYAPFTFDAGLKGNSNRGHEGARFGTEVSDEQRWQLVEYMKTL